MSSENNLLTASKELGLKSSNITAIGNFYFQHQLKDSLKFVLSTFKLTFLPINFYKGCLKACSYYPFKNLGTE